jgi:hypothetical protein
MVDCEKRSKRMKGKDVVQGKSVRMCCGRIMRIMSENGKLRERSGRIEYVEYP